MILSAVTPHNRRRLSNPYSHTCCCLLFCPNSLKLHSSLKPKPINASSSLPGSTTTSLRHLTRTVSNDESKSAGPMLSSASAVASAIRQISTSPVEFLQSIETDKKSCNLVLPSPDFQTLCVEQLDLFRRTVDPDAILSVSSSFISVSFL